MERKVDHISRLYQADAGKIELLEEQLEREKDTIILISTWIENFP